MAMRLARVFRLFSSEASVMQKIRSGLGDDAQIEVIDVSGGCGAMFHIKVSSPKFNGISMVQQHKLVSGCIKDEDFHGFKLETFPL